MTKILSVEDLNDALKTITYKQGWEFMVWEPDDIQGPMIMITINTLDADLSKKEEFAEPNTIELRIVSPVPPMHSYEEFYNWFLWRIKQIELHEVLEWFKIDHVPYIDPHQAY